MPSALLRGGLSPEQVPVELTEEQEKIAQAAMAEIERCEAAGMSRYQLIEWMNMGDGVRRMLESHSREEIVAMMVAELRRAIPAREAKDNG